jgi:DNA-binding transcriptional regulator YiaG
VIDTDSGVAKGSGVRERGSTPGSVSRSATTAVPDFLARLEAEIVTAGEVAQRLADPVASSLGVGEVILSARELAGLSQRALAQRACTSQAAVTAMETGNRLPTVRTLMRVVEASGFQLVVGFRVPGDEVPRVLGALVASEQDGLADYVPMVVPSVFTGPPGSP